MILDDDNNYELQHVQCYQFQTYCCTNILDQMPFPSLIKILVIFNQEGKETTTIFDDVTYSSSVLGAFQHSRTFQTRIYKFSLHFYDGIGREVLEP
eukprot:scaffold2659_cov107-Cylindrotheca_fusiformis.AAC.13